MRSLTIVTDTQVVTTGRRDHVGCFVGAGGLRILENLRCVGFIQFGSCDIHALDATL
jgi:hypothetical protein